MFIILTLDKMSVVFKFIMLSVIILNVAILNVVAPLITQVS
jgi:hypothetical protein